MNIPPKPQPFPVIYHDGQNLYLEFPGSPGFVLRFAYTEGGLHKALKHIPSIKALASPTEVLNHLSKGPQPRVARSTARKRELAKASPGVRSAATSLIRKLKVGG